MAALVVLTTVAARNAADRLARSLVKQRLAACVTALPGATSHYRWKGKPESSREVLLLIKTDRRVWPRLLRYLRNNHPYELPEAIALSVAKGSKEYLSWLDDCLKK